MRSRFLEDAENERIAQRARLRIVPGFRLLWGRTWPKERGRWLDGFVAFHPERGAERSAVQIMKDGTTPHRAGQWSWIANFDERPVASGWESDAGGAARAGERAYWRRREDALKAAIRARLGRHRRPRLP